MDDRIFFQVTEELVVNMARVAHFTVDRKGDGLVVFHFDANDMKQITHGGAER